ncbi:MAG TPA: ubiquinone/menaquinone biosynthesis methyltransferase [Bacteroidales bacterium]|nr:ubiquinone/menaquinone biosynthesis methyltransferase [Bacteroidales bacterium]HNS47468.1 ubiquinone/menaquinone biosynthesis methyltransferase [Bacteroidales bacterium]
MNQQEPASRPLQKMFNEVPRRYDLMNRLLTFRLDEHWRKKAARICLRDHPAHVVDLCTGTGDLACHLARNKEAATKVTALDFSEPMLEEARRKIARKKLSGVEVVSGDVSELPFQDQSIDAICIGFGFRNLTWKNHKRERYLSEIHRVLKQGGKFVIVETGQPENWIIRKFYHLYLYLFVNFIGARLSGNKKAYQYLATSAIHFYSPEEIKVLLKDTGFKIIIYNPLFLGAAALTIAYK